MNILEWSADKQKRKPKKKIDKKNNYMELTNWGEVQTSSVDGPPEHKGIQNLFPGESKEQSRASGKAQEGHW